MESVRFPADVGTDARRFGLVAARLASACAVFAIIGMAAYLVFSGRGGARPVAEQFLDAMRTRDAGAMMRVSRVDSGLLVRADDLLARLPRLASYHLGEETRYGSVAHIPAELVGPSAGRPVEGVGRQRMQITLTLTESGGLWRVDAERFFRDAFAAALPDGLAEYEAIAGDADNRG